MNNVRVSAQPLPSEMLLMEHLPAADFQNALVLSPGRAQIAALLLERSPQAQLTAWYIDLHQAALARAEGMCGGSGIISLRRPAFRIEAEQFCEEVLRFLRLDWQLRPGRPWAVVIPLV